MAPYPAWYEDSPDWATDKAAHGEVVANDVKSGRTLHRAARHHNWLQVSASVQNWTNMMHKESQDQCRRENWSGLNPVVPVGPRVLVTHRLVRSLDSSSRQQLQDNLGKPDHLLAAARAWHQSYVERSLAEGWVNPMIWVGEKTDVETNAPFDPSNVHHAVSALGLWHFGFMPADFDGAVLRLVYEVGHDVPLFKPDWRHGYANFYWASSANNIEHGMARDLATGFLRCKEWVTPLESLDARKHLKSAQCVLPAAPRCHYDVPDLFWSTLTDEIRRAWG